MFLANKSREKITTIALADNTEAGASIILQGISDRQVLSMEEVVRSVNTADDRKVIGIEDLYEPLEFLEEVKEYYAGNINLPNIKINTNFTKYSKLKLANGIVAYIEKYINDNNPNYFTDGRKIELDKTGVAMQIYKKLIFPESKGMNKNTEKIFAEIFKKLDSYFEQKVSS